MADPRIALVTGAARGIGRACAETLARSGFRIALNDVVEAAATEAAAEMAEAGHEVMAVPADVSDYAAVEAMIARIVDRWGGLHVLVNNAGISPKRPDQHKAEIAEMDPEEWRRVVDVNLNGVFNCIRVAAPILKSAGWGRIVNMSSMAARAYSTVPAAHYVATKTALLGLTRCVAGELAPHNVLVNAICPGRIESEMMRAFPADANAAILGSIPRGRFGTAEDIAGLVGFLCSDAADYIVGATLDVSGGRNMV